MNVMTITVDNLIQQIYSFESAEAMEAGFTVTCADYGVEATDADFENGYMELECGTTICINSVYPFYECIG
jgi:hypothetical protein